MPTFKSAKDLAYFHRKRARRVGDSLIVAHQELAQAMVRHAKLLTSGSTKTGMLRYLDHPFARRHGRAKQPLLPINRQSGRLHRSIRTRSLRSKGEDVFLFQFTAPYAKYVLSPRGTRTMLPRRFWASLREYYKFASRPSYRRALRRANSGR